MKNNTTFAKRNPYKFVLTKKDMETPKGVSLTVQDDSYSVRDLYEKFTLGLDLGVERNAYYGDDQDHDDQDESKLAGLDLAERHELLTETKERARRNLDLLKQMEDQRSAKTAPKIQAPTEDTEGTGDDLRNDNEEPETQTPKKGAKKEGQKSATPS